MAKTRDRAVSGFHLWALLIAWALVLTPVLAAAGYLAYAHFIAGPAPLTNTTLPAEEAIDAGATPAPAPPPRLVWQGSMEEAAAPEHAADSTSAPAVAPNHESDDQAASPETAGHSAPADPGQAEQPGAHGDEAAPVQPPPARLAIQALPEGAGTEGAGTEEGHRESAGAADGSAHSEPAAEATATPAPSLFTGGETPPLAGSDPLTETARLPGSARGDDAVTAGIEASTRRDAAQPPGDEEGATTEFAHADTRPAPQASGADAIGAGAPVADDASPAALPLTRQPRHIEGSPEDPANAGENPAQAWQRHGETAVAGAESPRIAVVMTGLGLSAASTEAAIRQLPAAVTLSFTPYSRRLNDWIALARANNHEVLIDLPMEPMTFPDDDPGPYALLTVINQEENRKRLDWLLGRGKAFVGVAAVMGSRFTASESHILPVLETLKEKGLLYLDNRSSGENVAGRLARDLGMQYVSVDRNLDSDQASRIAINGRLAELERLAVENGFSVAIGQPYPVTIERVRDWSKTLADRGYALVPLTALNGVERRQQISAGQ